MSVDEYVMDTGESPAFTTCASMDTASPTDRPDSSSPEVLRRSCSERGGHRQTDGEGDDASSTQGVCTSSTPSQQRENVCCPAPEPAKTVKGKCKAECGQAKTTCRRKGSKKTQKTEEDPVYSDIIRCQICGDKASGMHYGVYSCEGCKGFFRRTQRLQIEYKPCPYWGLPNGCDINIGTRNKCQYCRYQKCLSLGMSTTAVRMGRVPKVEVRKLKEELDELDNALNKTEEDRTHNQFVETLANQFNTFMCTTTQHDRQKFWKRCSRPFTAHMPFGTYVIEGMQLSLEGPPREITSRAEMAQQCFVGMELNIEKFAKYAKQRDEFRQLSSADQLALFKGAALEVCATMGAGRYYHGVFRFPEINTYVRRDVAENSPFGQHTTYTAEMIFYEMFNELGLTDRERAIFCTLLLFSPDREGLEARAMVESHQEYLAQTLHRELKRNHPNRPNLFSKLMDTTISLRSLVPDHIDRLKKIKMRCNGHLPAEPSPLLIEVYGQIWVQDDNEDGRVGEGEDEERDDSNEINDCAAMAEVFETDVSMLATLNNTTNVHDDSG